MLQSLTIQNFQSHAVTALLFDPRLTVLVGASNHGKTAVLRAIGWILRNRPLGKSFIHHGEDMATVTLLTDAGSIARRKGRKGVNEYRVDGETLTALGSDVPEQVSALLNMGPINLADQLDKHFLLLDPPGQIARQLNEAVHLDRAEAVAQAAGAEVRDAKARVKDLEARRTTAEAAEAALAWVDKAREGLEAAREIAGQFTRGSERRRGLRRLLSDLAAVGREAAGVRVPAKASERAEQLAGRAEAAGIAGARLERLDGLVAAIGRTAATLAGAEGIRRLADVSEVLTDNVSSWQGRAGRMNRLADLLDGLDGARVRAEVLAGQAKAAAAEERGLLAQLTECPACGQSLTAEARRRLLA